MTVATTRATRTCLPRQACDINGKKKKKKRQAYLQLGKTIDLWQDDSDLEAATTVSNRTLYMSKGQLSSHSNVATLVAFIPNYGKQNAFPERQGVSEDRQARTHHLQAETDGKAM